MTGLHCPLGPIVAETLDGLPNLDSIGCRANQRSAADAGRGHEQARRSSDGGVVGGARGIAALRQGLRRGADPARLPGDAHRRRPRHRHRARHRSSPTSRSTCCTGGRARTAPCRASSRSSPSRTPIPASWPRRVAMQKDVAKVLLRAADVPVPEGIVASRFDAAKNHLLAPPYVIKPIAEGSSVGVFIVTEAHDHPPQELYRDDWALWRPRDRRKIHRRQGVDLRGDGRRGARRDRDRPDGTILRLRGKICTGRL